jgi:hypothetical protein
MPVVRIRVACPVSAHGRPLSYGAALETGRWATAITLTWRPQTEHVIVSTRAVGRPGGRLDVAAGVQESLPAFARVVASRDLAPDLVEILREIETVLAHAGSPFSDSMRPPERRATSDCARGGDSAAQGDGDVE